MFLMIVLKKVKIVLTRFEDGHNVPNDLKNGIYDLELDLEMVVRLG